MFSNRYFITSFVLVALIAVLNWLAGENDWYWTLYWYDFMMHFLGGLWLGLFLSWLGTTPLGSWVPLLRSQGRVILLSILVGIAWEIYELTFGITFLADKGYVWDTSHDLVMDTLGAFVGAWIFWKQKLTRHV